MQTERIENHQRHEIEHSLEGFRSLRLSVFSFGHSFGHHKEDTPLLLSCPSVVEEGLGGGQS